MILCFILYAFEGVSGCVVGRDCVCTAADRLGGICAEVEGCEGCLVFWKVGFARKLLAVCCARRSWPGDGGGGEASVVAGWLGRVFVFRLGGGFDGSRLDVGPGVWRWWWSLCFALFVRAAGWFGCCFFVLSVLYHAYIIHTEAIRSN